VTIGCVDCTRTELLRRAVAEAGRGLPGIEPGMPLPAGTGLTRRAFVSRTAGLALGIYGGSLLSGRAFEDGIAQAAATSQPVLVSVFMEGGIDSLSVLFPAGDPQYYALRPRLALAPDTGLPFPQEGRLRWHPAAAGLATLHAEGKLSVFPAIGYDHSDKSHFTSRHYWEVGATDAALRTGWLGRYLDQAGVADNPLQGLSLDARLQPALATARMPIASLEAVDRYTFTPPGIAPHPLEQPMFQAAADLGAAHLKSRDPALLQAAQAAVQSHRLAGELPGVGAVKSPVAYPQTRDPFPGRLAGLAELLARGLPVRVAALTATGHFDTHASQPNTLRDGLQTTSDALLAFQRDLEARGIADRVLVHVWSEFGRRARENGSSGTDHGAAGVGFVIGSRVNGNLQGEFPGVGGGLDDQGNLRPTADFRAVYAALLEQWLGVDGNAIIPAAAAFSRPQLLR
jgi:uncharacterized protein (DUF1501 family)